MKGKTKKWALIASLAALFVFAPMAGTSIANNAMPTAAAEEVATIADTVATIEETGKSYDSLSAAINAATAGQTIKLTANVSGNVTISKNLTIDGDGKTYTGTMTMNTGLTVTVKNVNFYNAGLTKARSTTGAYTFKNCTFDGANKAYGYAISFPGASKITVEDCTVKDYSYGFMYFSSSLTTHSVKNVTVENCNYGVRMGSTNTTNLVNFTTKNVKYPVQIQANAARTVNMKDCKFEGSTKALGYWDGTSKVTFNFTGVNDLGMDAPTDANLIYKAAAQIGTKFYEKFEDVFANAKLGDTIKLWKDYSGDAIELAAGIELDANGFNVGAITLSPDVAMIGETSYQTLAAAVAVGGEIKLLKDINENVTIAKDVTIIGNGKTYTGTMTLKKTYATINFNNINFDEGYVTSSKGAIKGSYINVTNCNFVGTGYYALAIRDVQNLTVDNCTAKNFSYGFIYVPTAHNTNVVVKNTTIENVGLYGVAVTSGLAVDLTNVTVKNAYRGIYVADTAVKTSTLTNCTFENVTRPIDVSGGGYTYNVNFVGVNDLGVGTIPTAANVKYTGVQAGTKVYETLGAAVAAATAGNTIKLLGHTTESAEIPYNVGFDYNGFNAGTITTKIARNLTLSGDITLNFYVNKTVVDVTEYTFGWTDDSDIEFIPVVDTENSIYNIYKIGITPQLMDKEVTLTVGGVSMTSSVVDYCDEALVGADAKLTNLLVDLLNYGAAAQAYMGAEEVMDVSGYVGGTEFVAPANNYVKGTDVEGIDFGDSNVAFNNTNKLVWYFQVTDTTATVTLTKNGVAVEGKSGKFMDIAKPTTYMGVECYMIETDEIKATELDASYVLTVAGANGTVTVEFSVADYVAYHANSNSADANLAKALWCYGQSAKAYNA